jgi:hypothetical protein
LDPSRTAKTIPKQRVKSEQRRRDELEMLPTSNQKASMVSSLDRSTFLSHLSFWLSLISSFSTAPSHPHPIYLDTVHDQLEARLKVAEAEPTTFNRK